MSQTAAFDLRNSQKLRTNSKKYERPAPPENPVADTPAPRLNIFERMDISGNSRHDNSLRAVIDTVPDTRYILLFIIYHVIKLYADKEQQAAPLMTPASFTAYCLFLVYGFLLLNDYHGRPFPSYYATDFMDSDSRAQLFEHLKRAYVPPFMLTLFHGLTDTADPRRPGLQFFPTFAGSRFAIDFGRIMPPQIFLAMHNISAEQDTSRPGINAMNTLMAMQIFKTTANSFLCPGHFLGAATPNGTYRSWLYNAVLTLFSPVTGKSLTRRTNMEPINLFPLFLSHNQSVHTATQTSNLYTIFLNASPNNVRSTSAFINEFSNIAKNLYSATFQLGAVPDDLSGVSIMTHAYTLYALPTWHTLTITDSTKGHKSIEVDTYAAEIKYLQEYTHNAGTSILHDTDALKKLTALLYLGSDDKYSETDDHDTTLLFHEDIHVAPLMQWLQPYTQGDQAISYSMISGLIIESFELDGSSIPMPDPTLGMRHANNLFLQGSLPLCNVKRGYTKKAYEPVSRTAASRNAQKVSLDFYNMAENRIPEFFSTVDESPLPTSFPGFSKAFVRSFKQAASKLSFLTSSTERPPTERIFDVWSPYRYVIDESEQVPTEVQILMILNHRCLYGTSVPLTGTQHASAIIPIS